MAGKGRADGAGPPGQRSRTLLDNDHVRVLELRLAPGQSEPMHSHPRYIVYVLSPALMRMTGPDGASRDVRLQAGQVHWGEPTTHAGRNIGDTELHELIIELKGPGPA